MRTQTVLVTGGAGFIGSTLVDRLLAEGRRVVAVDDLSTGSLANLERARAQQGQGAFEFQRADVVRGGLDAVVERHRPEVVVHLAARGGADDSVEDPVADAMAGVVGTVRVLEACRRHGVGKVVHAATGGRVAEQDADLLPLDEDSDVPPLSPREAAQRSAEQYLRAYESMYGLRWTSLVMTDVYGPRQGLGGGGGPVSRFVTAMLDGRPVTIHGDPTATLDLVYVDDVVHALALAMERGDGERFMIGTGKRTEVGRLFTALAAATDHRRDPVQAPARPGDAAHTAADATWAAEELGWKPWTTLEEGLAATLRWAADQG